MKILYSGFRWTHHSTNSGYDKVANFPGADYIADTDILFGGVEITGKIKKLNWRLLDIATKFLQYKYNIIHLIHTEQQLYYPYLGSSGYLVGNREKEVK
jgi:hypothetical protein